MKKLFRSLLSITIISVAAYAAYAALDPTAGSAMAPMDDAQDKSHWQTATFAGGCFWCMEKPFESVDGVKDVISGYIGGHKLNPTYREVSSGTTGHVEAVQITYDPQKTSYQKLLDVYWHQIDPTDAGGSFVDRGSQYRSVIFYHDEKQHQLAEQSKAQLNNSGIYPSAIVTEILAASQFYHAEDYHQNYYKENPIRYEFYRHRSGRDQYLEKIWANQEQNYMLKTASTTVQTQDKPMYQKPADTILKKQLTPLQYQVTQQEGTERPFDNAYWNNKAPGIYVDIVSGEPLFSSTDKYDSKTGWPSFTKPIAGVTLKEKVDRSLFSVRTEVRSPLADSHLGHVFDDGPAPTGKRYCINSAALRFVPLADLEKENYAQYLGLFK